MDPPLQSALAYGVLLLHLGIISFNVFWIVAIPLGAWRGWCFVYAFWWRALHLGILSAVALQAILHRACFLTIWQIDLLQSAGSSISSGPLISGWINRLIYWPLPLWLFALFYVAVCIYVLLLWWLVPPRRTRKGAPPSLHGS